jgi:DNA-binding NarL/FixJ family response regulator
MGLSPVMVGRGAALSRLIGLADAATVGAFDAPQVALVSGDPGIGKSRLLREFVDGLSGSVASLTVAAQPGSQGRPYDLIRPLLPAGAEPSDGAALDTIAAAVASGPTLLTVDDLHWADAASAYTLERILQQPWGNLVVVLTYRPTDLARREPGGELVARVESQYTVEQIRLDRLDRADVALFVAAVSDGAPSSAVVDAILRRSGGVPFVVEELLRFAPHLCTDDLATVQLPWTLDEAVTQQIGGLDPASRKVIDVLAISGDPCSFETLAEVADLPEAAVMDALRTLVQCGTVVEQGDDAFALAHALTADVVARQLLGRERRRLHDRFLAALRAADSTDSSAMARHAIGAGRFDEVAAIAREGACRYLAQGASFQALRLASDGLAEAPDDAELLAVATDAAWRSDFESEAVALAERWLAVAPDDLCRVEAMRMRARLAHEAFDIPTRDRLIGELEEWAETLDTCRAQGRAYGALAQLHMLAHQSEQARSWADCAIAVADHIGDEWQRAQAMVERASSPCDDTPNEEIRAELLAAADAARDLDDAVLESRALNNLLSMMVAHAPDTAAVRARFRDVSARGGLDMFGAAASMLYEAEAACGLGDLAAARRALAEASSHFVRPTKERLHYLFLLAHLRAEEGRADDTQAAVAEHVQIAGHEAKAGLLLSSMMAAMVAQRRAEAESAWAQLAGFAHTKPSSLEVSFVADTVAVALAADIAPERVRAEFFDVVVAHSPSASAAQGHLLLAEHRVSDAVVSLQAAIAEHEAGLDRASLGTLRLSLAQALLADGDRPGAAAALDLVLRRDLAAWPGWRRDRAEAFQRRLLGSTGRSGGDLTSREMEVAELISQGLTNSQLAERLFISPKTAAVHVSNILTKLGVSGRAEVAAWVVRRGLAAQAS